MRLYIKSDFKKKITFTTRELLWKMWFKEWHGHPITYSNVGDDEMLQDDFYFVVSFDKWRFFDSRWNNIPSYDLKNPWNSYKYENISLEFEKTFITEWRERGDYLRIATSHIDVLTVDKRAMYIMAAEVASAIDGQISEDDKQTWMDVETFKELHKDVLSLTYDEAVEISLEELKTMIPVRDPLWEEEERLREEYIKIHGERVYDDEEEEREWNHIPYDKSDPWNSFSDENIQLEFENDFITDGRERGENLRIATTHTDILMVDKRAMYIMAVEVASAIDGQISEDNKHTWMDVEIFKELHKDVLSLTYDQATDISVEELKSMKPIEDPLWDEEERLHEEYIKIHGERVYDDEEED